MSRAERDGAALRAMEGLLAEAGVVMQGMKAFWRFNKIKKHLLNKIREMLLMFINRNSFEAVAKLICYTEGFIGSSCYTAKGVLGDVALNTELAGDV